MLVPRSNAEEKIQARIAAGDEILQSPISTAEELERSREAYYTWNDYNSALLSKLFAGGEADEYRRSIGGAVGGLPLAQGIRSHRGDVQFKVRRLSSLLERLDLYDEPDPDPPSQEQVAVQLIDVLDQLKEGGFASSDLLQKALDLNAGLAPTFTRMYGVLPVITTTYPNHIWWPRARDEAANALAAARSGFYEATAPTSAGRARAIGGTGRVFIVHGRDHALKETVARFVENLGFEAVILHERPNGGATVIEKFEREADADFAIVLLTADDEGSLKGQGQPPEPRARQNVVFEFGYFFGALGRGRVVALELQPDGPPARPSDLGGLLYIPVSRLEDRTWRVDLAREMKAASLDVDMNELP